MYMQSGGMAEWYWHYHSVQPRPVSVLKGAEGIWGLWDMGSKVKTWKKAKKWPKKPKFRYKTSILSGLEASSWSEGQSQGKYDPVPRISVVI